MENSNKFTGTMRTISIDELFKSRIQYASAAKASLLKLISIEMAMISLHSRAQIERPTDRAPKDMHILARTYEQLYEAYKLVEDLESGTAMGGIEAEKA